MKTLVTCIKHNNVWGKTTKYQLINLYTKDQNEIVYLVHQFSLMYFVNDKRNKNILNILKNKPMNDKKYLLAYDLGKTAQL